KQPTKAPYVASVLPVCSARKLPRQQLVQPDDLDAVLARVAAEVVQRAGVLGNHDLRAVRLCVRQSGAGKRLGDVGLGELECVAAGRVGAVAPPQQLDTL